MAFIKADVYVPQTGNTVAVSLYFPTDLPESVGNKVKGVITLLHGYTNGSSEWMMFSAACRYAADNGFILVCPAAENSFYHDMAFGPPWYTIISELLPQQLQNIFKIPTARNMNYIAGLSMGGYGAMRIGLSHPERYAAIGSFSGCLDLSMMALDSLTPGAPPVLLPVLGPKFELPPGANCMELAAKVGKLPKGEQPRVFCTCGLQDVGLPYVLEQTRAFHKTATAAGLDVHSLEWNGVHEWNFWDRSLAEFIGFAQNSDYGKRKQADWSLPATLVE